MKTKQEGTNSASNGIRVHSAVLKQALKKVAPVANGKGNVLPIVSGNVRVSVNGNEAAVYATDLSTSAKVKFPVLRLPANSDLVIQENEEEAPRKLIAPLDEAEAEFIDEPALPSYDNEDDFVELVEDAKTPRYKRKSKADKDQEAEAQSDVAVAEVEPETADDEEFTEGITDAELSAAFDDEIDNYIEATFEDDDIEATFEDDDIEGDNQMPFAEPQEAVVYEDDEAEFSFLLPLEVVPVLDALNCPVRILHDKDVVTIITDQGNKYRFPSHSTEDYPTRQKVLDYDFVFIVSAEVLLKTIKSIAFAVGEDVLRPAMTGIYVEKNEDDETIKFVATNAHILLYKSVDAYVICYPEKAPNIIIPPIAFKLLAGSTGNVTIKGSSKHEHLELEASDVKVRCVSCEGKYPPYQAVIPSSTPPIVVSVGKVQLLTTLRRAKVLSDPMSNKVIVEVFAHEVRLSCSIFGEDGDKAIIIVTMEEALKANVVVNDPELDQTGMMKRIAFNAEFLYNLVQQSCTEETVSLSIFEANQCALVNAKESEVALIMPLMIS